MSYIFKFNNTKKNKFTSSNPCFYHLYMMISNKQNFCWCPYILTQEHFCQRLLFISPAKIEIYAKQMLYPLKFTHCGEWANRPGDVLARNRAETSTSRNWRGLEIGGNMHGRSKRQPLSCLSRCRRWTVQTCCRRADNSI